MWAEYYETFQYGQYWCLLWCYWANAYANIRRLTQIDLEVDNPEYMLSSIYEFGIKARGASRASYPPYICSILLKNSFINAIGNHNNNFDSYTTGQHKLTSHDVCYWLLFDE